MSRYCPRFKRESRQDYKNQALEYEEERQLIMTVSEALSDATADLDEEDTKQLSLLLHMWRKGHSHSSSTKRIQKKIRQFLEELLLSEKYLVKAFATKVLQTMNKYE